MGNCQEIIRKVRRDKNLSQEYVAYELGISQKSYSNIENGKTTLKLELLEKLCLIFDTNLHNICSYSHICNNYLKKENEKLKSLLFQNNIDFSNI